MKRIIYGLIDPRTLLIRYVGQSSRGLTRPRAYIAPSVRGRQRHLSNWVAQLERQGLSYQIAILEHCIDKHALNEAERFWIAYGRGCGWPLINKTDGGEGCVGYRHTAAHRKRVGELVKGYWEDEAYRAAVGRGRLKYLSLPETKLKLAERVAGDKNPSKQFSLEIRERIGKATGVRMRGVPKTPEHKAKLRDAAIKRWADPEQRAQASRSASKRYTDPEERVKARARTLEQMARKRPTK